MKNKIEEYAVFDPEQPVSFGLINIASSVAEEPQEFNSNTWADNLYKLDQEIKEARIRANLANIGINTAFKIPEFALGFASRTAIPPWSYILWGIEKKTTLLKTIALNGVESDLENNVKKMASSAVKRLLDSDERAFDSLFPVGDPAKSRRNIRRSLELLDNELSGIGEEAKSVILNATTKALLNMENDSKLRASIRQGSTSSSQNQSDIANWMERGYRLIDSTAEDLESSLNNAQSIASATQTAAEEFNSKGKISDDSIHNLEKAAENIYQIAGTGKDVLNAMTALGLDTKVAEEANRVLGTLGSAGTMAFGLMNKNPFAVISGMSGVVTSMFGSSNSNGMSEITNALKKINKTLDRIADQNEKILKKIKNIERTLSDIQINQIRISQLDLSILRSIEINRNLIINSFSGPLDVLENRLFKNNELQFLKNPDNASGTYDQLKNAFRINGPALLSGITHLERIFTSKKSAHPILLTETYRFQPRIEVAGGNDRTVIDITYNSDTRKEMELQRRIEKIPEKLDQYFFTENASLAPLLFSDDIVDRIRKPISSLEKRLIEPTLLVRFVELALRTSMIHEVTIFENGVWRLKTPEEILDNTQTGRTGFQILEVALHWVNTAISQQLILSRSFDSLLEIASGDIERARHFEVVPFLMSIHYGKGNFEPRWIDQLYAVVHAAWKDPNSRRDYREEEYEGVEGFNIGASWLERNSPLQIRATLSGTKTDLKESVKNGSDLSMSASSEFASDTINLKEWSIKQLRNIQRLSGYMPWARAYFLGIPIQELSREAELELASHIFYSSSSTHRNNRRPDDLEKKLTREIEDFNLPDFIESSPFSSTFTDWRWNDSERVNRIDHNQGLGLSVYFEYSNETLMLIDLKRRILEALMPMSISKNAEHKLKEKIIDNIRFVNSTPN